MVKKQGKYIAVLGPLGLPIPPKRQGGIEWMVYYLTEGLIKKGYKILLFAPKGTRTSAQLIPVCSKPIAQYNIQPEAEASRRLRMELSILTNMQAELLRRKKEVGLVFNHTVNGGVFAGLEKILGVPVFHVVHLPLYKELADVFKKFNARLISISNSQRKPFPYLRYATTIYNGINLEEFPFRKKPKDYFIFSGKMRASKNPLSAIVAAKKTREKLILVGKINDRKYFEEKIKPLLFKAKNISYLGEVSFLKIKKLYSGARALLFPIRWEEPFGLVMIEAMACGTPVIAFNRASVPEVVKHGKTGFIVNSEKEMVMAMKKIDEIKREDCRTWVKKNFSAEKMINAYEKICRKTIRT